MKGLRSVCLAVSCALAGYPALASVLEQEVSSQVRVELLLRCGAELRIEGHEHQKLQVESHAKGPGADTVEVQLRQAGNSWQLVATADDGDEGAHGLVLTVRLPTAARLTVDSVGGPISARALSGTLSGSTVAGSISLAQLDGATVALRTGAGMVRLSDSLVYGQVETGAGVVIMEDVQGEVNALAPAGDVIRRRVRHRARPAQAEPLDAELLPLDIQRQSGHLSLDRVWAGGTVRTGSGHIEIEEAAGPLRVETGSGHIEIASMSGALDARAQSGDLRVGLAQSLVQDVLEGRSSAVGPVRLTAPHGRIVLSLPQDLPVRIEGEVIYDSRRRVPRLESDLPLSIDAPQPLLRPEPGWRRRADSRLRFTGQAGRPLPPGEERLRIVLKLGGDLRIVFHSTNPEESSP